MPILKVIDARSVPLPPSPLLAVSVALSPSRLSLGEPAEEPSADADPALPSLSSASPSPLAAVAAPTATDVAVVFAVALALLSPHNIPLPASPIPSQDEDGGQFPFAQQQPASSLILTADEAHLSPASGTGTLKLADDVERMLSPPASATNIVPPSRNAAACPSVISPPPFGSRGEDTSIQASLVPAPGVIIMPVVSSSAPVSLAPASAPLPSTNPTLVPPARRPAAANLPVPPSPTLGKKRSLLGLFSGGVGGGGGGAGGLSTPPALTSNTDSPAVIQTPAAALAAATMARSASTPRASSTQPVKPRSPTTKKPASPGAGKNNGGLMGLFRSLTRKPTGVSRTASQKRAATASKRSQVPEPPRVRPHQVRALFLLPIRIRLSADSVRVLLQSTIDRMAILADAHRNASSQPIVIPPPIQQHFVPSPTARVFSTSAPEHSYIPNVPGASFAAVPKSKVLKASSSRPQLSITVPSADATPTGPLSPASPRQLLGSVPGCANDDGHRQLISALTSCGLDGASGMPALVHSSSRADGSSSADDDEEEAADDSEDSDGPQGFTIQVRSRRADAGEGGVNERGLSISPLPAGESNIKTKQVPTPLLSPVSFAPSSAGGSSGFSPTDSNHSHTSADMDGAKIKRRISIWAGGNVRQYSLFIVSSLIPPSLTAVSSAAIPPVVDTLWAPPESYLAYQSCSDEPPGGSCACGSSAPPVCHRDIP